MKDEVPDDLPEEAHNSLCGFILLNSVEQLFWVVVAVVAVICYYAYAGLH
ncbi:hypothetical protein KGQ24_02310 [Patescibacteria group bacterium]|nr:hypothetical protein [Patescibacteria group bacterium]